jgi:hypothetical protein
MNLHAAWDTSFVERLFGRQNERTVAKRLAQKYAARATEWQGGKVNLEKIKEWVGESDKLTKAGYRFAYIYPQSRLGRLAGVHGEVRSARATRPPHGHGSRALPRLAIPGVLRLLAALEGGVVLGSHLRVIRARWLVVDFCCACCRWSLLEEVAHWRELQRLVRPLVARAALGVAARGVH